MQQQLQQTYSEELYNIPGKLMVFIPVEWHELTPSERELLSKILASVKHSLDGVQVISRKVANINEFLDLDPAGVLLFGCNTQEVPAMYEVVHIDRVPVVLAEPLSQLEEKTKKEKLWAALKQMFSLA
jgi:hypothetical protein